ncbi:MAG: DNA-directed RNA polymerase subunit beta, partial [Candidatus Izemoplasmatales bacterium]|nr:DNA-directed RNA polymerase subunit beta [Candidatus Izemoplasmatales bacterium]
MNYKTVKYGKTRERRNYSRVKSNVELPNLIEVQTESFKWFMETGLKELFQDISPITNFNGDVELYFGDFEFEPAKYSVKECKEKDLNYSRPLKVSVRLKNKNLVDPKTGEVLAEDNIIENKIFMGDIPMMTPVGTFIINGSERVIVSQIVRSAGVFFSEEVDKKTLHRKYVGQVIPTRGAWLEYEMGSKDILYAKIDRSKKILLSTMIKALGFSTKKQIVDIFGDNELLENTFEKDLTQNSEEAMKEVYAKIRQGETATIEGAREFFVSRLFNEKRYDLADVGRFKVNQKLDVVNRVKSLLDKDATVKLSKDLINPETGEVILSRGTVLNYENIEIIKDNRPALLTKITFDKELEKELKQIIDRENRNEIAPENEEEAFVQNVVRNTFVEILNLDIKEDFGETIKVRIIGNNTQEVALHITTSDIIASISYYLNLFDRIGTLDDIDHLGNRRLRLIGELLKNQFRIGLAKMEKNVKDRMSTKDPRTITPQNLVNIRPLTSSIKEFFGSSQLSQFMQQTNPLDELTHKRRISALGPGGLTRDRAGFEVRDVHQSHYGRICPIETPEGQNIGLINSLACYVKVNKYGFIETPYLKIDKANCRVTNELHYLSADQERDYVIAQANVELNDDMTITEDRVVARLNGETRIFDKHRCDFMDVSPKQIVSVSTASIPFLEHDDANRALMGANMQRQAIPLLKPEAPFVGTGIEYKIAHDSGTSVIAMSDGVVEYVDG